jgi:hypothetical protein
MDRHQVLNATGEASDVTCARLAYRGQATSLLEPRELTSLGDAARWPDAPTLMQAVLSMDKPASVLAHDALAAEAFTLDRLEAQVLDPVNRLLGQRWAEERCGDHDLVIAQSCLMSWARRLMKPAPALCGLLRWCRARAGSPEMMAAQATLIDVAATICEQRFDTRALAAR